MGVYRGRVQMRIAIIGWGSLIWAPRELALESRWHKDGPELPVEFARRSGGGRLTLVTLQSSELQRTYWATSRFGSLDAARENLRMREGTPRVASIHWASKADSHDASDAVARRVQAWLVAQDKLDGAVWAGLEPTLSEHNVVATAVAYLMSLSEGTETYRLAHEYMVKAPPQIQTPVRKAMQQRGWLDEELPEDLFEAD